MEQQVLAKRMNIATWVISAAVLLLVGAMRRPEFKIQTEIDFSFLPPFHSTLNALAAVALIFALYFIKQKNITAHRNSIFAALTFSALFLLSYVVYHFTSTEVRFGDANFDGVVSAAELSAVGTQRTFYLILLASHVALAGLILPFILITFTRAITQQFDRHKKMARWVYPLWLYVAITGPICYLMLRPFYPG
jgi:putative membrane protein